MNESRESRQQKTASVRAGDAAPDADAVEQDAAGTGGDPDGENAVLADAAEGLEAQLAAARRAAEENRNKLLRLQAEMDNLRKRTARDVDRAHKYALERFVDELLPVIDSLELGISAADTSGDAGGLRQGMELTLQKLLDVTGKFGVEPVDPLGRKFNPELHEAVSMQESGDAESGTVISVMQKGYTLNQRLIRPAMVVVAK